MLPAGSRWLPLAPRSPSRRFTARCSSRLSWLGSSPTCLNVGVSGRRPAPLSLSVWESCCGFLAWRTSQLGCVMRDQGWGLAHGDLSSHGSQLQVGVQVGAGPLSRSSVCTGPPPPCVFRWSSLRVCLCPDPLFLQGQSGWTRAHLVTSLPQSPLRRPHLQTRSHSEMLGVRALPCALGGPNSAYHSRAQGSWITVKGGVEMRQLGRHRVTITQTGRVTRQRAVMSSLGLRPRTPVGGAGVLQGPLSMLLSQFPQLGCFGQQAWAGQSTPFLCIIAVTPVRSHGICVKGHLPNILLS